MRRVSVLVVLGALALGLSSCAYTSMATSFRAAGKPVPWWCAPTEEIRVNTGPAVGPVDYYAGTHKSPLSWDACERLSAQFDAARTYAEQWKTEGAAEADGWRMVTSYVEGMGTHHVRGGITPAMLADPSFDPQDPILDGVGLDAVFDPSKPEVLQFDGNGPTAKLVGFDYYVRTSTGRPPEGFPCTNDWWHVHPSICHRKSDAMMIAFNSTDASCTERGGVNVKFSNYYMLHVWVLDDMVYTPDVYAGMMPCIKGGTAVHDALDKCHTTPSSMTMATEALAGL